MSFSVVIWAILLLLVLLFFSYRTYRDFIRDNVLSTPDAEKLEKLNELLLPAGFAYSSMGDFLYLLPDCWQRRYGYCRLYDETLPYTGIVADCEPITFSYQNRRWLIEFRKGQYGLSAGAEVGVYCTPDDDIHIPGTFDGPFYKSVMNRELLPLSVSFYRKGQLLGKRKDKVWRLAVFYPGTFCKPEELSMKISITFPDKKMCQAYTEGLIYAGYLASQIRRINLTVTVIFSAPRTPEPIVRHSLVSKTILHHNQLLCLEYRQLTRNYIGIPDKLECLRLLNSHLYQMVLDPDSSQKLYNCLESKISLSDILTDANS